MQLTIEDHRQNRLLSKLCSSACCSEQVNADAAHIHARTLTCMNSIPENLILLYEVSALLSLSSVARHIALDFCKSCLQNACDCVSVAEAHVSNRSVVTFMTWIFGNKRLCCHLKRFAEDPDRESGWTQGNMETSKP